MKLSSCSGDGLVQLPPGRVDDLLSAGNILGTILYKTINIIVLHHIGEEVFLAPSGEHPPGNLHHVQLMGGADNRRLMITAGQATHLLDHECIVFRQGSFSRGQF